MNSLPDCQTLHLLREDSTLRVTINRPETRNALTAEVVEELTSVADAADADTTLRTIILRGAEGTFCAGGDIKGFKQSFEAAEPKVGERDPIAVNNRKFGNFLIKFNSLPQTVVGVIEGAAFGGGLGLVCITDIAICGADTKFALSETGLGIPPAQIAPFVVQRVGLTTARRIALSGARFDGTHAKEIGLVHFAEPDATAIETRLLEVLTQINRCAPGANAATKKIILDSMSKPLPEVLDWAADAFALQLRGDEGREGVRAFLEKRPASWVEQQG